MWLFFALGSAFFAGITAVLAKIGIEHVNSTLATAEFLFRCSLSLFPSAEFLFRCSLFLFPSADSPFAVLLSLFL